MLRIGITGGMGSGKSLVCKLFNALGVPVFDADRAAKSLMQDNLEIRAALIDTFGRAVYLDNGNLNRKKLAGIVFKDQEALKKLNAITHPATIKAGENWMQMLQNSQVPPLYALKEAALLFEANAEKDLDAVVGVFAPKEKRIERIIKRDKTNKEAILNRMDKQMEELSKMELCDYVILNDEIHLLWPEVLKLDGVLKNRSVLRG